MFSWCSYIYENAQNGSANNILDPVGRAVRPPRAHHHSAETAAPKLLNE